MIAEAGANHNRDLGIARELIDVAADAGADAVKFQTYTGSGLYSSKTPRFEYLKDDRSPNEILEAIALPREWQPELAEHARRAGIAFFSTPFDDDAVDSLAAVGVPAMKIASFEIVDLPLIRTRGGRRRPDDPLDRHGDLRRDRGRARRRRGGGQLARSRCCAARPSIPRRPEIMNLRAMATMREAFGVPVGLSDHTRESRCRPPRRRSGSS